MYMMLRFYEMSPIFCLYPWLFSHVEQKLNSLVSEQEKMAAAISYHTSQVDQLRTDIDVLKNQGFSSRQALEKKVLHLVTSL